MRLFAFLPLALLLGCPGETKESDSKSGTDDSNDTDVSNGTDNDADGDGYDSVASGGDDCDDTDPAVNPGATEVTGDGKDNDCDATTPDTSGGSRSFSGSTSLYVENDGSVDCDINVTMTGTEAADKCPDCDFSFSIQASTTDTVGDACYYQLSWIDNAVVKGSLLAFNQAHVYAGYYGDYTYYNALLRGFSIDDTAYGYGYYAGPYWFVVAHDDSYYGSVTVDGNNVSWTFDYSYTGTGYQDNYYSQYCDYIYSGYEKYLGSAYTGSWNCADGVGDVWTFNTIQGATTTVSIDTVAAESAFDPYMYLIASDTCLVGSADDSFDCAFEPPDGYQCPSASFTGDGDPVTLVISGFTPSGSAACAGSTGDYDLQINSGGEAAPDAELAHDDVALETSYEYTNIITSAGSGTITE